MFKLHGWLCLLSVLGSAACGDSDDGSGSEGPTVLEGTWAAPCAKDEESSDYGVVSKKFEGGVHTIMIDFFSDAACADKLYAVRSESAFVVGGAATVPADATTYDITPTAISLTLANADLVSAFNGDVNPETRLCQGGFAIGVETALDKAVCPNQFSTVYGIFKIDGVNLFEGLLGDSGSADDASAADKRPKALKTRALVKQ